ncbi:probable tubulin polyglutamylase ttll-15 [Toxorhynchites rutilus septentrionalis]|uniref:probable tubulin polyglutamylase ttll-15 n=1 Tax=Toxorhynchites rutilus septentrionalis TaxID=329112 RepID=UPI00247A84DA|nr:probable tubulin polyglutamylase ttll-15 [Toxorhynchites rutilus septentrionalis]XP_055630351.1 probable tubulin polyglutamylase ttll-15 [Toxorhynchites rutilus septentrionalis]
MTEKRKLGKKKQFPPNAEDESEMVEKSKVPIQITHQIEELNCFFDLRTKRGQLLFFTVTILAATLTQCLPKDTISSILQLREPSDNVGLGTHTCKPEVKIVEKVAQSVGETRPKYWIYGRNPNGGHLIHVQNVLQRLGVEPVSNDTDDWDLLWAHDYPFRKVDLHHLKPHQLVNHFPGSGFITNKVDLSTTEIKYIPKAFKLPSDETKFRQYAQENPDKRFVQKNNQHRYIEIKQIEEIDFGNNDTFIQEYIDDPLLVDGYKFDIGVYTVISSIDPLRIYIYKGDILFRYCPVKYHPFDAKNLDKYIVGDDYLPTWELPALKPFYAKLGFGMKDSFDAYLRQTGRDPSIIWEQVEDAIRLAILKKEPLLAAILSRYASKRNFFEMMRFDLVVDNKMRVFLMEANMSPNLSSAHFKPNRLLYEQVIYNFLRLVGVGSDLVRESFAKRSTETEAMVSSLKNIVVEAERCSVAACTESCALEECSLCAGCLSGADLKVLHAAFREHINRGDMKRIFPVPKNDRRQVESSELNAKNRWMSRWFNEKCKADVSYCY